MRVKVTLACTECKQRNYNTMKNKKNTADRIEMNKYCPFCKKHTLHKDTNSGSLTMAKTSKGKDPAAARKNKAAAMATQKRKKGSMKEYFKGVKLEMKKVVWPTKKELGSFTAVVLVTCAAFALVFWAVDTGVLAAIKAVCF